jgi:hypothetical protein
MELLGSFISPRKAVDRADFRTGATCSSSLLASASEALLSLSDNLVSATDLRARVERRLAGLLSSSELVLLVLAAYDKEMMIRYVHGQDKETRHRKIWIQKNTRTMVQTDKNCTV